MPTVTTDAPLGDIEFLARSPYRVRTLNALSEEPRSRSELREATGASPSTVGRLLREFEERRWIRRTGHEYETTQLGAFVASGMADLLERIETERQLREVWIELPIDSCELSVEAVSDATVTLAEASAPYRPIDRFVSLLEGTDRFRFLGSELALIEPCRTEACQLIADGMRAEIIDPPAVAIDVLEAYPELCARMLETGNVTIYLHDDLPEYSLCLLDDRVAIPGYDPVSGTVRALIDTGTDAAREWAESTFVRYRREAEPLPPLEAL